MRKKWENVGVATGAKTTVEFTEPVMAVVAEWKRRGWTPRELVNTAIMLFHMSTPDEREKAKIYANYPDGPVGVLKPLDQYKAQMVDALGLPVDECKQKLESIWLQISGDPRLSEDQRIELAGKMSHLPTSTPRRRVAGQ